MPRTPRGHRVPKPEPREMCSITAGCSFSATRRVGLQTKSTAGWTGAAMVATARGAAEPRHWLGRVWAFEFRA